MAQPGIEPGWPGIEGATTGLCGRCCLNPVRLTFCLGRWSRRGALRPLCAMANPCLGLSCLDSTLPSLALSHRTLALTPHRWPPPLAVASAGGRLPSPDGTKQPLSLADRPSPRPPPSSLTTAGNASTSPHCLPSQSPDRKSVV